jgi:SpoIIAA-like
MPMNLSPETGNVFRIEVSGLLRKSDFERVQERLVEEMGRVGPVRLLFILERFEGWEPGDNWSDLTFYVTHGDRIERIAIVGDERWRGGSLMFAAADLRKAPVEFFPSGPQAANAARSWLAAT